MFLSHYDRWLNLVSGFEHWPLTSSSRGSDCRVYESDLWPPPVRAMWPHPQPHQLLWLEGNSWNLRWIQNMGIWSTNMMQQCFLNLLNWRVCLPFHWLLIADIPGTVPYQMAAAYVWDCSRSLGSVDIETTFLYVCMYEYGDFPLLTWLLVIDLFSGCPHS